MNVSEINELLAKYTAEDRIKWAVQEFGDKAVLLSSMQKTAAVLMHMFHSLKLANEILFVDTGFHFYDTLRIRDLYQREYNLNIVTLYPKLTPQEQEDKYGEVLWRFVDGQTVCCRERKEIPFLEHIKAHGKEMVMTGLMKAEGGQRAWIKAFGKDPRINGYSFRPIYDWTEEQVMAYLKEHSVPVHRLHSLSYPSIGCHTCTTPVMPGEDPRAGRWRHLQEPGKDGVQYCGINFSDGSGI